jgi:hypothetical protein
VGGGGGGAGAQGEDGLATSGGSGGAGLISSISGVAVEYARGGGGCTFFAVGGWPNGGAGPSGSNFGATTNGAAETGSGGGAAWVGPAGAGGSGVVIFSIPSVYYSGAVTGTQTVTVIGTDTIIRWTGNGSYTA